MPLFQATVAGGLEDLAAEEMMEKLCIPPAHVRAVPSLGRVYFQYGEGAATEELKAKLCSLRCVCNLFVVVLLHPNFFSEGAPKEELIKLHAVAKLGGESSDIVISSDDTTLSPESDVVLGCGWHQALEIWKHFFPEHKKSIPYRVTGDRKCTSGKKQQFTSLEAAVELGGQIHERFAWEVNLSQYELEVLCAIRNTTLVVSIALTESSLSRRVTEHLGTTHLSGHIAFAMIMLCRLQPGEVVVDTMCGGGSLGISAALARGEVFSLNGDMDGRCATRTARNCLERAAEGVGGRVAAVRWDARRLPLREGSVDVVVVDMPFGRRVGSKADNVQLYPQCLREIFRVLRPATGRGVVLTTERRRVEEAVSGRGGGCLWGRVERRAVFFGGVRGALFSLHKPPAPPLAPPSPSPSSSELLGRIQPQAPAPSQAQAQAGVPSLSQVSNSESESAQLPVCESNAQDHDSNIPSPTLAQAVGGVATQSCAVTVGSKPA